MISHAGLRKGDVSSWQGKKDIFIFTFFFPSAEMYYLRRQSLDKQGRTARLSAALGMAGQSCGLAGNKGRTAMAAPKAVFSPFFILHLHLLG